MPARRIRGRVIVHPRGFGFVQGEGADRAVCAFVPPAALGPFLEGDGVEADVVEGEDERPVAVALRLVARRRAELFGQVARGAAGVRLRPDRAVASRDRPLEGGSALPEGTHVVAAVDGGRAIVLREVEPADAGLERVLVRHGIRTTLPDACRAELAALRPPPPGARRDLREMPTVTIDSPAAEDLDDALAVLPAGPDGALRALVSIADVDAVVAAGSALDGEARRRGTSVYLAGRVVPMLPRALSAAALSLLPRQERLAVTVEMRIDGEGEVTAVDVYESVVRSHARLSYGQVAAFLDEGAADDIPRDVLPTLRWLRAAAGRLSAARSARGGIELDREDTAIHVDATTGEPTRIYTRTSTSAHRLVERFMVAANEAVARWLAERGMPAIYRVHDAPDAERVEALAAFAHNVGFEPGFGPVLTPRGLQAFEAQFKDTAVAPAMYTVLGRLLGGSRHAVAPGPHFGLAAPLYTQFTSPSRRYADLAVHRVVKAYLAGRRDLAAGDPGLAALAEHLDDAVRRANRAESDRMRMLAARLFGNRLGERHRGHIVAVKPFGLVVELVGSAVSGVVAYESLPGGPFRVDPVAHVARGRRRAYALGEPLDVEVAGAQEELGRIELVPASARAR